MMLRVRGVVRDSHTLYDIGVTVPRGGLVDIPIDLAKSSKDYADAIARGLIRVEYWVPPPISAQTPLVPEVPNTDKLQVEALQARNDLLEGMVDRLQAEVRNRDAELNKLRLILQESAKSRKGR